MDGDAGASNVRSTVRSTDAGTDSSQSTNFILSFTTSTVFTTSARGLEHCADIVRDSAPYNR
jgi:hypothetical protein